MRSQFSAQGRNLRSVRGFTLIELLIVLAIAAILIGLLAVAVLKVCETDDRTRCQNNLKQLGMALHGFHDVNSSFPACPVLPGGGPGLSWHALILPYIGQTSLYSTLELSEPAYPAAPNGRIALTRVSTFLCPSQLQDTSNIHDGVSPDTFPYTTHYCGNAGPKVITTPPPAEAPYITTPYNVNAPTSQQGGFAADGVLPFIPTVFTPTEVEPRPFPSSVSMADITDGTSNTLMIFEVSWDTNGFRSWARGFNWNNDGSCSKNVQYGINQQRYATGNYNDISMGSMHDGGLNIVMGDGSVHFFSDNTSLESVLIPLASRAGHEKVLEDY
jgi:prepilin-type N-terminal cleavage/methylation domain-containing protein/prepilin-type processing-associated H-X9-DG protein